MGNHNSKKSEIDNLKQKLSEIDKNHDNKVSKEELNAWIESQKQDIETIRRAIERASDDKYQKLIQENNDYKNKIKELECHIDLLSQKLQPDITKSKTPNENNNNDNSNINNENIHKLSKQRINEFVDRLLEDQNTNIKYLPDFVEKQIYRNVFDLLINVLEHALDSANVQFLGHTMSFDLKPTAEQTPNN